MIYDNTRLAVARILGGGARQHTRVFSELQSHYVFADRFGRPGKGNDKGKVEGLIGWIRRNLLVPVPWTASFTALNEQPLEGCRRRLADPASLLLASVIGCWRQPLEDRQIPRQALANRHGGKIGAFAVPSFGEPLAAQGLCGKRHLDG